MMVITMVVIMDIGWWGRVSNQKSINKFIYSHLYDLWFIMILLLSLLLLLLLLLSFLTYWYITNIFFIVLHIYVYMWVYGCMNVYIHIYIHITFYFLIYFTYLVAFCKALSFSQLNGCWQSPCFRTCNFNWRDDVNYEGQVYYFSGSLVASQMSILVTALVVWAFTIWAPSVNKTNLLEQFHKTTKLR